MKKEHMMLINVENEYAETYDYLNKFKNLKQNFQVPQFNHNVKIDKTVWILWLQGIDKAPEIVRKCILSIEKNLRSDFEIVLLDENNIFNYVCIPNYIYRKYLSGDISKTHMSDIIRIELLFMYGGCWVDATVFCSGKIPDYILDEKIFFFSWSLLGKSVLKGSSWWITAKKGNRIIELTRNYLQAYWESETTLINYYLLHIIMAKVIDEDSACMAEFRGMPYLCNSDPHILYSYFDKEYDPFKWEIINSISKIHKLSYKRNYLVGDIDNFYCAFLDGRIW